MYDCQYCERGFCTNTQRGWCFETKPGGQFGEVNLGNICCKYCKKKPCRLICKELIN